MSVRDTLTDYEQATYDAIKELTFLEESSKLPRGRQIPQIRWPNIEMQDILGFGGFSQVNLVLVKSPEIEDGYYALKCLDEKFLKTKDKKRVIEAALDIAIECDILSRLDHINVIGLHGTSVTSLVDGEFSEKAIRDYFILLDVLDDTLLDRLQSWRRESFFRTLCCGGLSKEEMVNRIETAAVGVARGMSYLHEKQVVLRDLKPENVGFDKNGVPKLFDFGFARESHSVRTNEIAGSHCYMAPEMALGLGFDITADVYSFGVVLWELSSLQKPYEQFKMKRGFRKNRLNYSFRPSVTSIPCKSLQKLISECWSFRSSDRPNFKKIIKVLEMVPMEVLGRQSKSLTVEEDDTPSPGTTTTAPGSNSELVTGMGLVVDQDDGVRAEQDDGTSAESS